MFYAIAGAVIACVVSFIAGVFLSTIFREPTEKRAKLSSIEKPPGYYLLSISQLFFSRKNIERVIEPFVADMQHEYFEALSRNDFRKTKGIIARYYLSFPSLCIYSIFNWSGSASILVLITTLGGLFIGAILFSTIGAVAGAVIGAAAGAYRNRQLDEISARSDHG